MEKQRFEYVYIPYTGRNSNGLEWRLNEKGFKTAFLKNQPVIVIIRKGNNSNTAGGSSVVGYQLGDDSNTRQKTVKKLIEVNS